jgi:hypothetical protein
MGVNFRSAVFDKQTGALITNPKKIAKSYFFGWFPMDLISSIPLTWIELVLRDSASEERSSKTNVFKIARVLRLGKLFRIVKLVKIMTRYLGGDEFMTNPTLLMVFRFFDSFKLVVVLFLMGHIMGCLFYLAGSTREHVDDPDHPLAVRARPGQLSALSVSQSNSVF